MGCIGLDGYYKMHMRRCLGGNASVFEMKIIHAQIKKSHMVKIDFNSKWNKRKLYELFPVTMIYKMR